MKHFVENSYFEVVSDVNTTWGRIKRIPDYRTKVGVELFTRMFEFAPTVWSQFPWGNELESCTANLKENKTFAIFARNFVAMLDLAIDMLGPDLEMVESELQKLGVRHISYGVMPKHYPLMGRALLNTMEHLLGDFFTAEQHESWNAIYTFMSVTMMQGAFQELVANQEKLNTLQKEQQNAKKKELRKKQQTGTAAGDSKGEQNKAAAVQKKSYTPPAGKLDGRTSEYIGTSGSSSTSSSSSSSYNDDDDRAARRGSVRRGSVGYSATTGGKTKQKVMVNDNENRMSRFSSSDFLKRFYNNRAGNNN